MHRTAHFIIGIAGLLTALQAIAQVPSQIPVTGNLNAILGGPVPYSSITVQLQNCPSPVTITGYNVIVQQTVQLQANSQGLINSAIWPNDQITCNGTTGNSQYRLQYIVGGVPSGTTTCYQVFQSQKIWNLNTQQPIACSQAPPNPQDATYRNLDVNGCLSIQGSPCVYGGGGGAVGPGVPAEIAAFQTSSTVNSVPGMVNLSNFAGANPQAQFTTAIGNASSIYPEEIFVGAAVPGGTSTSYPSASTPLNSFAHVFDMRGTNNPDWTWSFSGSDNALGIYTSETRQDSLLSYGAVNSGLFDPAYRSLSGGVYNYIVTPAAWNSGTTYYASQVVSVPNGAGCPLTVCYFTALGTSTNQAPPTGSSIPSSPARNSYWLQGGNTKSTRFSTWPRCAGYTVAQDLCVPISVWKHSDGEADAIFAYVVDEGGYKSPGQEPSVGIRTQVQQYETAANSTGGVWAATVTSVTGSSPTFTVTTGTPTSVSYALGERPVRDLSKVASGTGFTIGNLGVLTMTSGGLSTFPNYATSTAFSRLNTGSGINNQIIAQDATFCVKNVFGSPYHYCVPVDNFISDTQLQVWNCQIGANCIHSYTALLEGASTTLQWAVYASALPTSVNSSGTSFTAQGAVSDSSIPISIGDLLDQPLSYNTGLEASYSTITNAVSTSANIGGHVAYGDGVVGTNDSNSTPPPFFSFASEANAQNHFYCQPSAPTTTIVPRYCFTMTPWAYSGFASLPSTAPTVSTYSLLGKWLQFIGSGTAMQLGGPTEGLVVNMTNGNVAAQGSISSPSGGVGYYEQDVSDSMVQAGTPNTSSGNSYWVITGTTAGASVTPNATADPFGTSKAFQFTAGTLTGSQTVGIVNQGYTMLTVTPGETVALSVWLKSASGTQPAEVTLQSTDPACQSSTQGGGQIFVSAVPTTWTLYNTYCTFSTSTTVKIFVGAAAALMSGTQYYAANPQVQVAPAVTQQVCSNPSPVTGTGFILKCAVQAAQDQSGNLALTGTFSFGGGGALNSSSNVSRYCGTATFSSSTTSSAVSCSFVTAGSHCTATWNGSGVSGGALGATPGSATVSLTAATSNSGTAAVFCSVN